MGAGLLLLAFVGLYFSISSDVSFAGVTNLDTLELSEGLIVTGGGITSTGATALTGNVTVTGNLALTGTISGTGSLTSGGITATSTGASMTMTSTDFVGKSLVQVTPTVPAVTLTFPASSTLAAWLPNAGDSTVFTFANASTSPSVNVTIAGTTGVLLRKATTTAVIPTGGTGIIHAVRKSNSDILLSLDINS